jgi:hypothetical protein
MRVLAMRNKSKSLQGVMSEGCREPPESILEDNFTADLSF